MRRRSITTALRVRIFRDADGLCHICGIKIAIGEPWECEHRIPIAMGGADAPENMRPAHIGCHAGKTKKDVAAIAKAKRIEAKHIGAFRPKRKIPSRRFNQPFALNVKRTSVRF